MSKRSKLLKPFWFEYEAEMPTGDPEAEGLREAYGATIAERTAAALSFKRRQGYRVSRQLPYGYRLDGQDERGKWRLAEVPEQQAAIRLMVDLREAGLSLRAIAALLKEHGIKRQNGSLDWPSNVVLMILRRQRKLGDVG